MHQKKQRNAHTLFRKCQVNCDVDSGLFSDISVGHVRTFEFHFFQQIWVRTMRDILKGCWGAWTKRKDLVAKMEVENFTNPEHHESWNVSTFGKWNRPSNNANSMRMNVQTL